MTEQVARTQSQVVEEVFQRIASDLSMIADREFVIESVETERLEERAAGQEVIHISFRLNFVRADETGHGCLLVPLPDAISLACYLMMVPEATVEASRSQETLDATMKDAILEVGSFISGATDSAMRALGLEGVKIAFDGCQGVRAGVRPALVYEEGDPLLVGRARVALRGFPTGTMLLMIPASSIGQE